MDHQDVITFKPKPIKHIFTITEDNWFSDKNLLFLRNTLNQKGPMSVKDILTEFKESKEVDEKSDKTIYRYLGKLKDAGIVIQVGKRIFMDEENNIRTETLFGVTAKFFLIGVENSPFHDLESTEAKKARGIITEFVGHVLSNQFKSKKSNTECLEEVLIELVTDSSKVLVENFETSSIEAIEKLIASDIGPSAGNYVMDFINWLGIVLSKRDLYDKVADCFK